MLILIFISCLVFDASAKTFSMSVHKTKFSLSAETKQHLKNQHLKRTAISATGVQPLTQYFDEYYVGNITIGTPPQAVSVAFDATTTQTWITATGCKTAGCNKTKPGVPTKIFFDTNASSTFVTVDGYYTNDLSFGGLGQDVVNLGGISASNVFGVSRYLYDQMMYYPFVGIFALGWNNDGTSALSSFLSQMDQPIFTAWYDMKYSPESSPGGEILFGGIDTTHCSLNINYVPIAPSAFPNWQISMTKFSIGTYFDSTTYPVIVDTRTDGLGVTSILFNAIFKQLKAYFLDGNANPFVACSRVNSLPDIVVTIGNIVYRIPSSQYVINYQDGSKDCQLAVFDSTYIYFGDVWLRSYCNVFDVGRKQIGFSQINRN